MWFLLACAPAPADDPTPPDAGAVARVHDPRAVYADARAHLEVERTRLAGLDRGAAREEARALLTDAVRDELAPAWFGTPWAFYGTTQVPGEGTIACGYFVSTVLEHAGLRVERVLMAQQASEYIVKTFSAESELARFRKGDEGAVVDWVRGNADGLYVVGLDTHVGLLVKRADTVELCHSAYTGDAVVTCSDPLADVAFQSRYHVVGPVLTDRVLDAWLDGARVRTFLPVAR